MSTRFLSAYVLLLFAAAICRAEPDNILSKKILGSWAWKKVETFYANGKWELRKYEGASPEPGKFSWQIKSGKLIRVRDGNTFTSTIVSINAKELVLRSSEGGSPQVYTRTQLDR
jgi:hypothetical protein